MELTIKKTVTVEEEVAVPQYFKTTPWKEYLAPRYCKLLDDGEHIVLVARGKEIEICNSLALNCWLEDGFVEISQAEFHEQAHKALEYLTKLIK